MGQEESCAHPLLPAFQPLVLNDKFLDFSLSSGSDLQEVDAFGRVSRIDSQVVLEVKGSDSSKESVRITALQVVDLYLHLAGKIAVDVDVDFVVGRIRSL